VNSVDEREREELEGLLSRSLDGELTPTEEAAFAERVARDADARRLLDEWSAVHVRLTDALSAPSHRARQTPRNAWRDTLWRVAAAAVLVCGGVLIFQSGVKVGRARSASGTREAPVIAVRSPAVNAAPPVFRRQDSVSPGDLYTVTGAPVPVRLGNDRTHNLYRIPVPGKDMVLELEQEQDAPRLLIPVDY
jgi:anti-sigma factor RsiW